MSKNLPILRRDATQSFCSICPDPGHCCRKFHYHYTAWVDEGIEAVQQEFIDDGLPFIVEKFVEPYFKDPSGREYSTLMCSCPKVTPAGLCSIYADRPPVCRKFAAGSDPLCVFSSMSGIEFKWDYPAIEAGENRAKIE